MTDKCDRFDAVITPYVDDELPLDERAAADEHAKACPPCQARADIERSVHDLIRARRDELTSPRPSDLLRARCADAARSTRSVERRPLAPLTWRARLAPLAAAASLVLIVGAAFLYQLTASSTRVMAAELAADHVKCFALNGVLHTHDEASTVESSMVSGFGWQMHLRDEVSQAGLELVGARPCLYGGGKIAHIMYRHNGEPVSLFMLPRTARAEEIVQVMGHGAAIWCVNDRTFVLLAREPKQNIERMASIVRASLR